MGFSSPVRRLSASSLATVAMQKFLRWKRGGRRQQKSPTCVVIERLEDDRKANLEVGSCYGHKVGDDLQRAILGPITHLQRLQQAREPIGGEAEVAFVTEAALLSKELNKQVFIPSERESNCLDILEKNRTAGVPSRVGCALAKNF